MVIRVKKMVEIIRNKITKNNLQMRLRFGVRRLRSADCGVQGAHGVGGSDGTAALGAQRPRGEGQG